MSGPFAFVTLITSDSYLPGALVVAASLRELHPHPPTAPEVEFKTVCLVTPETVDVKCIKALRKAFDLVIGVEVLEAENSTGLQLLGRPDLTTAITKLHVFRLTEFSKIIYIDADILPIQPLSHLFLTPHEFSASPDVGWPDIFNSGFMVLNPGEDKFQQIIDLFRTKGSWDGADQGLLNEWRGDNWNRLSFTYNVTPTAAYTYAPAYQRFGSAIKAIHFIGQNKPWTSIPWRAPIAHPSADTMRSYGYSNLVDRWFAVYDRHYRPPVIATEEQWRTQQYEAAWETATFDSAIPSMALGLEDLRRLAVGGTTPSAPVAPGEAEYRSMPLEGRVDLMRPERPVDQERPADHGTDHSAGWPYDPNFPPSHRAAENEYRPPGREGLPSYLYRPPSPAKPPPPPHHHHAHTEQTHEHDHSHTEQTHVHDHSHEQQQQQHRHHHEGQAWDDQQGHQTHEEPVEYRPPSPPLISWNPALEPPPSNPPPVVAMAFAEQQYSNVWDLPPSRPMPIHHPHQEYRDPWTQQYSFGQPSQQRQPEQQYHQPFQQSHDYRQPHQQQQHSPHRQQHHHHHHHSHRQQEQHHQHYQEQRGRHHGQQSSHHQYNPPTRFSPPQEIFYPGNSTSHQPTPHHPAPTHVEHRRHQPYPDAHHGQNVYEQHATRKSHGNRPEDFFRAPEPTKIPEHLVREGHYTAVTTEKPQPDSRKVGVVFPWEEHARPRAKRVFPDWDPKPPRVQSPPRPTEVSVKTNVENATAETVELAPLPPPVVERQRSPSPPPHVKRKFNPPPSPPLRQGQTYVNAWDTDKGIQRYASVLQGRPSPFSPQPWPTHPGQEASASASKKPPAEKEEEEEEYTNWAERAEASSRDGDDEDDDEDLALLSPKSAARRRAAKEKGKSYRHQGVQTEPIITESRGVQVSISTEAPKRPLENNFAPAYRQARTRTNIPAKPTVIPDPKRVSIGTTSTISDLPSLIEDFKPTIEALGIGSPTTPILKKRESSEDSMTTAADSSVISSPTKDAEEAATPKIQIRSPEVPPVAGRGSGPTGVARRGRFFSPNTGMEIFKRGSEEVLARFLSQQPTDWEAARQANAGPATPSANY